MERFPSGVKVLSKRDPSTTGNFEVTVNGVLVHSKRTKGHGFLERNPEQIEKVFAAIEEALDAKEK